MEIEILQALQNWHNSVLDGFFCVYTTLGNGGMLWFALAIGMIIFPKTRMYGVFTLCVLLVGGCIGTVILKNVIARPRPYTVVPVELLITPPSGYSFPSGHAMQAFLFAPLIYEISRKAGIAAYVAAAIMAFSRLYLFVHYPSDVLAGILLGWGIAYAAIQLNRKKWHIGKALWQKSEITGRTSEEKNA